MIRTPPGNNGLFEPGANYPETGLLLSLQLHSLSLELFKKDPHSAFGEELAHRSTYLKQVRHQQLTPPQRPFMTWWGESRRLHDTVSENGSLTLFNATGLQVKNITSMRLDGLGDDDYTATVNEPAAPYSISRRLKRREKRPV